MHAFIKKNMVMVIALLAAAITSIIIPPDVRIWAILT